MAEEGNGSNGFIIIAKSTFCREGTESNFKVYMIIWIKNY